VRLLSLLLAYGPISMCLPPPLHTTEFQIPLGIQWSSISWVLGPLRPQLTPNSGRASEASRPSTEQLSHSEACWHQSISTARSRAKSKATCPFVGSALLKGNTACVDVQHSHLCFVPWLVVGMPGRSPVPCDFCLGVSYIEAQ
jgi:hypothetical protein